LAIILTWYGIGLDQWFSNFFHIPPLQTQTLSIPVQQRLQTIIEKISHYLLWRKNWQLWTRLL